MVEAAAGASPWGSIAGAGIGGAATMVSASMARKDKKKELAEAKRQHEQELGMQARQFAAEKESEGSNREASALNNVIEGLRKSLRR
jgi:hypothetical protein